METTYSTRFAQIVYTPEPEYTELPQIARVKTDQAICLTGGHEWILYRHGRAWNWKMIPRGKVNFIRLTDNCGLHISAEEDILLLPDDADLATSEGTAGIEIEYTTSELRNSPFEDDESYANLEDGTPYPYK